MIHVINYIFFRFPPCCNVNSSRQSGSGCKPATLTTTIEVVVKTTTIEMVIKKPPTLTSRRRLPTVSAPWLQAAGGEAFRLSTAAKRSDCQRCVPLAASRGLQREVWAAPLEPFAATSFACVLLNPQPRQILLSILHQLLMTFLVHKTVRFLEALGHEVWVMENPLAWVDQVARVYGAFGRELLESFMLVVPSTLREGCKQQWAPVEAVVAVNDHCVASR